MGSTQRFPNEELVIDLCELARALIRNSFPDHERLWSACDYYPEVKLSYHSKNERLTVEHSMIFRRAGGKIYKTIATNRIYKNSLESISATGIKAIFEGWTKDFLEKVSRAKKVRDETVPTSEASAI